MTTQYLLDTCVLSEFVKPKAERKVVDWLNEVLPEQFGGRVLVPDSAAFVTWGKMMAEQKRKGETQSAMESLIAAIALEHKMVLVTGNVGDFKVMGLSAFNPWGVSTPPAPRACRCLTSAGS